MQGRMPITRPLGAALSPELTSLFALLRDVSAQRCGGAQLRVAGGWVRDMLLGKESNDIDIAIESSAAGPLVSGADFARCIADHLSESERGTVSVIKTNPDKSKHIETAQLKVRGVPLEFCHLRHDAYSSETRIPEVRPGTPFEDASRRDFACNALFYNLSTELVEDYCGGLADLERRVLRCPLAPFETFMDDPLRILRGVRFSGQLQFRLDDSIRAALTRFDAPLSAPYPFSQDCGVLHPLHHALIHKVSRERAAIELTKMLSGLDPLNCVAELINLQLLFRTVLVEVCPGATKTDASVVLPLVTGQGGAEASAIMSTLGPLLDVVSLNGPSDAEHARLLVSLSSMLFPLFSSHPSGLDPGSRVECVLVRWLKFPNRVSDGVGAIVKAALALHSVVGELRAQMQRGEKMLFVGDCRSAIFSCLRLLTNRAVHDNIKLPPPRWAVQVCCCAALIASGDENPVQRAGEITDSIAADCDGRLLHSCVAQVPVRGKELSELLKVSGPQIAEALAVQQQFILHNPYVTQQEVVAHLCGHYSR